MGEDTKKQHQKHGNGKENEHPTSHKGDNKHRHSNSKNSFKGAEPRMNGHVFQLMGESPAADSRQCDRTIKMLKNWAAIAIKNNADDLAPIFDTQTYPVIAKPENHSKEAVETMSPLDLELWKDQITDYGRRNRDKETNCYKVFQCTLGQCSKGVLSSLHQLKDWATIKATNDVVMLLISIRRICHKFEETRYAYLSVDDAKCRYYGCKQGQHETNQDYYERVKGIVETLDQYEIELHGDPAFLTYEWERYKNDSRVKGININNPADRYKLTAALSKIIKGKVLAVGFIKRADRRRYGGLIDDLYNQYSRGTDQYPQDLSSALAQLNDYKVPSNILQDKGKFREKDKKHKDKGKWKDKPGTDTSAKTDVAAKDTPTVDDDVAFIQNAISVPSNDLNISKLLEAANDESLGYGFSFCTIDVALPPSASTRANQELADLHSRHTFDPLHPIVPTDTQRHQAVRTIDYIKHKSSGAMKGRIVINPSNFSFCQNTSSDGSIPNSWILLDSQSTICVFKHKSLLRNLRTASHVQRIFGTGGYIDCTMIGDLPGFNVPVWYSPDALANILALSEVSKQFRVTMDTSGTPGFTVHRPHGDPILFSPSERGLHFFDTASSSTSSSSNTSNDTISPYFCFINTVSGNISQFTKREVKAANDARKLYRILGRPSVTRFKRILDKNLLKNCPVTSADVTRAEYIFGKDVAALQGKTVKTMAKHVPSLSLIDIPPSILKFHQKVALSVDVFFVQGLPFLHTISRNYLFRTVESLPSQTKAALFDALSKALNLYHTRGLSVETILADNQFGPLRNLLLPIMLNICAADEHVTDVERSIRTIKDLVRATCHGLPFRRLPRVLIQSIVRFCVAMLNMFPADNGISPDLSPRTLVTGLPTPSHDAACRIELGAYAQVHEHPDPSNTNDARTHAAIALRHTGNSQGAYYFLSLSTWRIITRRTWDELPMPDNVIAAVEAKAAAEGQPLLVKKCPVFEWAPGNPILDLSTDSSPSLDTTPADMEERSVHDDPDHTEDRSAHNDPDPSDTTSTDDPTTPEPTPEANDDPSFSAPADAEDDISVSSDVSLPPALSSSCPPASPGPSEARSEPPSPPSSPLDPIIVEDVTDEELLPEPADEAPAPPTGHPMQLRPNRATTFDHLLTTTHSRSHAAAALDPKALASAHQKVVHYAFTQMSAKKGIETFGEKAIEAIIKEYAQLDSLGVFDPLHSKELTSEQRQRAIRTIDLIKEKRCGKIKARTVADGRQQRAYIPKEDASSPTVSLEALLLTLLIDAHEGRDTATADVPGAFLQAENDDFVVIKITGKMVDYLVAANPSKFSPYVEYENGMKVIYLRAVKAIYGLLKSALLWYNLFSTTLKDMGFVLNPYDKCVANMNVNGKQLTIVWYVDDLKISHMDPEVVTTLLNKIDNLFPGVSIQRGDKHEYLGMNIELMRKDKAIKLEMKQFLQNQIDRFPEDVSTPVRTPAAKGLFEVNEKSPTLSMKDADLFHSIVASLLWCSMRVRLDILLTVGFLCTRVGFGTTTKDDWRKLKRLMQYINCTIDMPRIISARNIQSPEAYADVAFAVHMNARSHTGGCVTFGDGVLGPSSTKQKLNSKSTTEAETIGASDYLGVPIWHKNFLEAQGYDIGTMIFNQDNTGAIKFAKNGMDSARQKSRHIHVRHFWIKDRLKVDNISIKFCPTHLMVADFFTKPLQGQLFRDFRDVIMGHKPIESLTDNTNHPVENKERVEKYHTQTNESSQEKMFTNLTNLAIEDRSVTQQDLAHVNITVDKNKTVAKSYRDALISDHR